jgi:hypothetical protein
MNTGHSGISARKSGSCGTLSSSTVMVVMMAMTPSLKASNRNQRCLANHGDELP